MGIRVHKAIGYGVRKFRPTLEFNQRREDFCDMSRGDFNKWVAANRQAIESLAGGDPKRHFDLDVLLACEKSKSWAYQKGANNTNYVFLEEEFGYKDALLIRPLTSHPDWYRFDDSIDYLEEHTKDGPRNRWKFLNQGLYPYLRDGAPTNVAAVCLFLGVPEVFPQLREALYVWWS
jgi:hypothetical protein